MQRLVQPRVEDVLLCVQQTCAAAARVAAIHEVNKSEDGQQSRPASGGPALQPRAAAQHVAAEGGARFAVDACAVLERALAGDRPLLSHQFRLLPKNLYISDAHLQRSCGGVVMAKDAGIHGQVLEELRRQLDAVRGSPRAFTAPRPRYNRWDQVAAVSVVTLQPGC